MVKANDTSKTARLAFGIAAVAVVAGCVLAAGCSGEPEQEGEGLADESAPNVKVVDAVWSEEDDPVQEIDAKAIEGIGETSLSEADIAKLGPYLTDRLYRGEDLGALKLSIVEVPDYGEEGYKAFNVHESTSGKDYVLLVGDVWTFTEGVAEPKKEEPQLSEEDLSGQAPSKFNSTETAFDERKAWPLSMRDKVEPLIGAAVADRLHADVNKYLSQGGVSIANEIDIMIAEDGVEKSGDAVEFTVCALRAPDRIVMKCTYDTQTMRHEIVWQP